MHEAMRSISPTVKDRVVSAVAELEIELLDRLQSAVRIPSINPDYPGVSSADVLGGETEAAQYMAKLYRELGAETEVFEIAQGRGNAVGVMGGHGEGRSLIYNGHHDVVPVGETDNWKSGDPFSGRIDSDRLWGRGATDMKGGLMAQAFAVKALKRAGIRLEGDLILESVSGEETGQFQLGTGACIERGYRADAAVVAEPSAPTMPLSISPTSMGVLTFRLSVVGRTTHSALRGLSITPGPDAGSLAVSAIDKGMFLMQGIAGLDEQWSLRKRHPLYPPGHFRIMPGVIDAGPVGVRIPYMVPDVMTVEYVVWHSEDERPQEVRDEVEAHVDLLIRQDQWLSEHRPTMTWIKETPPASIASSHPLCSGFVESHLLAAEGTRFDDPDRIRGFSAAEETVRFIQAGIPAINYGPGDLRQAHAADEYVLRDELMTATAAFALFAMGWCGYTASTN